MYGNILKHLLWADDLFLISTSPEKMQKQIDNLNMYCKKWQLIINTLKTKIMVFGKVDIPDNTFQLDGCTIQITDKYSYVGSEVSDSANPFTNIYESILQKCYRSCYKIREYCQQIGQLPLKLSVHFFDTLLQPIMDYGSEIWFNKTSVDKLSVFQRSYFRRVLHVRDKTSNNGLYGDLGIIPIAIRLKNNVLKYLHHIHSLPDTSPVKWVYNELVLFNDSGFSNWVSTANNLYNDHVISAEFNLETFLTLGKEQMNQKLKKCSYEDFRTSWLSEINNSDKQPKLRTYKKFETEFKMESYLNLQNVKLRTAIARFRLSAHNLRIETGRHTKPYTPVEKRLCLKCNSNNIQDEEHHLMLCEAFSEVRMPLLSVAAQHITSFNDMSQQDKFISIMNSQSNELIAALGTFLIQASQL